jgi:hypothetical protein
MPSRREVIVQKYITLTNYCEQYFQQCPFPKLEDIDISDLLYVFTYNFSKHYQDHDKYMETIEALCDFYSIRIDSATLAEHRKPICEMIDDFVLFLKTQK